MAKTLVQLGWLIVALVCLTMAVSLAVAQTTQQMDKATGVAPAASIIDENRTLFSLGAVVALLGIAGTAITAMVQSQGHIRNTDIHPTSGATAEMLSTKANSADCIRKHREVNDSFQRVYDKLDEVRDSVADGNTKIAGDLSYIKGKLEKE